MNKKAVINKVRDYLDQNFKNENTGHDYWHFVRVQNLAKKISKVEGGNLFIIELGALLHDIADWKFHGGKNDAGIEKAKKLLNELILDKNTIDQVCYIVDNVSFKGAKVKNLMKTKEGKIVQDADRLDATGAVGIARTFAYGGMAGREIFNPKIKAKMHKSFEEYKSSKSSSINHFYEKLLLLKDSMNTKTARKMAIHRHKFMENYLKEFFVEWKGKK